MSTSLFSVQQIMTEFEISKSSAYRLIDQALTSEKIRRHGAGLFKKKAG